MSAPFDSPDAPFGPGIPVGAVLGATDAVPAPLPPPAPDADRPPDDVAVATVSNRAGTVTVTATDRGLPLEVRIDPRELRYGGSALALAILEVCEASTAEAGARRRHDLAGAGVPADVLDRLGLPRRGELAAVQSRRALDEATPATWMRPV